MTGMHLLSKRTGYLIQWKEFLDEVPDGHIRSAWLFFEALVALNKAENWISLERDSPGQSLREAEGQLIDFHVSKKIKWYPFLLFKMLLKQFSNVMLEAQFQALNRMKEGEIISLDKRARWKKDLV